MRILLLALLLFGPFLDAKRRPFPFHQRRVQNNVVSRLRKILSNIETRGIRRENQTHAELQTIKDGMTEIKDTLKEIQNAETTEIPESHRIKKNQSEAWFDYSLGTFTQSCLSLGRVLSIIDIFQSVSRFLVCPLGHTRSLEPDVLFHKTHAELFRSQLFSFAG